MKLSEATKIVHGLSNPSKMPGKGYGLSAYECNVGSRLRAVENSVCRGCYALKGRYVFPPVKAAHAKRLASLTHALWTAAMATLTEREEWFRWHDSGDLMGMNHLIKIIAVAMVNPRTQYWLPTKEYALVSAYRKAGGYEPPNLAIRQSAPMMGQKLPKAFGLSSMVLRKGQALPEGITMCDAKHTMENGQKVQTITKENRGLLGHCGNCRACWDTSNMVTAYPLN
jgi:hypothetical protein